MSDKELIAEARRLENDYGDNYEVMLHMSDLADALEARQPSEDDRDALKRIAEVASEHRLKESIGEWRNALGAGIDSFPDDWELEFWHAGYKHGALAMIEHQLSRAAVPDAAIRELTEAIRLTVEYVGNDMLPAIEGWDWYDALVKYAPEVAQAFVDKPIHFPKPTDAATDVREYLHAKCDCVPDLGPAHCHLCSADGSPVEWASCAAVQQITDATANEVIEGFVIDHAALSAALYEVYDHGSQPNAHREAREIIRLLAVRDDD